jgi:hypothetical protein
VAFPEPKPGLVVRYDDLWTHQAAARRDQGKHRPACLVAARDSQTRPRLVVLLPITHKPPDGDTIGIEIPAKVKQAIGLDDARSWHYCQSLVAATGIERDLQAMRQMLNGQDIDITELNY